MRSEMSGGSGLAVTSGDGVRRADCRSCTAGYKCGCFGAGAVTSRKRAAAGVPDGELQPKRPTAGTIAPARSMSKLAASRLDEKAIRQRLTYIAFEPAESKWCCKKNRLLGFIQGSAWLPKFGADMLAKAVRVAREGIYSSNANVAHTALRSIAYRCQEKDSDKFDWRFFHKGVLGDPAQGVPAGIKVFCCF